jgi:hypothetical protein
LFIRSSHLAAVDMEEAAADMEAVLAAAVDGKEAAADMEAVLAAAVDGKEAAAADMEAVLAAAVDGKEAAAAVRLRIPYTVWLIISDVWAVRPSNVLHRAVASCCGLWRRVHWYISADFSEELLRLPEDGGSKLLRNVGNKLPVNTAPQPSTLSFLP